MLATVSANTGSLASNKAASAARKNFAVSIAAAFILFEKRGLSIAGRLSRK